MVESIQTNVLSTLNHQWVRGLTITEVGFEFRDRSSNPIVCQIKDDCPSLDGDILYHS